MEYKVVYNNGNPEDAKLICVCEDFGWAGMIALMLNERYHESVPDSRGETFYKVFAFEK